jgi:streptomycin 6-kinase
VLKVPAVVREKALALGAGKWLEGLEALVDELAARWSLTVGEVFADGTEALVLEVTCAGGRPAVLKLVMPGLQNAAAHELTVLRLAGGSGCAELLCEDEARGALLLERLGRPLAALGRTFAERQAILVDAASAVWRPAPYSGLPTGAEKARHLARFIPATWEAAGRPCSRAAVEHALACAARREAVHDDARAVLVHGDVHQWNALEAPGGAFKLVDPDGLLAEPEYDLGVLLREDPLEGDPRQRARWLATRTGLDAVAIAEWGIVERVATGLLATRIGLQPVGREMLAVADRLVQDDWRPTQRG